jgi:hypothetical protein
MKIGTDCHLRFVICYFQESATVPGVTMPNIIQSFLILLLIISLQIIVYAIFLRPLLLTWGASKNEVKMPLVGDNLAPHISSTRAITINAPISEVWKWLTQLGADRGGFFSYSFIEKALGYEFRPADITLDFQDMEVGRIVPGSLDESKSLIKYNFPVVAVEPGQSFVLKDWGAFVLKKINAKQTRLIVRTHGQELSGLKRIIDDFMGTPLHYIMERRMLMGFKARAEAGAGVRLSSTADNLWLLGIFMSAIGIAIMVFIGRDIQYILLSVLYSLIWLCSLLIFDPRPKYSLLLLLVVAVTTSTMLY